MTQLFKLLLSAALIIINFPSWAEVETQTISTRIVGGIESTAGNWPAIVSLKYNGNHFCGGTLIAKQWVVTAAHCVYDLQYSRVLSASAITATVGEYDLDSSQTNPTTIERILVHKDYSPNALVNDIALLELTESVTNESIPIASLASTNERIRQEADATVIGWGSTSPTAPYSYPNILNEVVVPLNTDQQCTNSLGAAYHAGTMLCAGDADGGEDACIGDSGGPLMINTNLGWQQIGIVSWGYGCAAAGSPGVYTRLEFYNEWFNYFKATFSISVGAEFLQTSINDSNTKLITIKNDSNNVADFTYEYEGSEYFSFDANNCAIVTAHSSCTFPVTYTPLDNEVHEATITVTSNIPDADIEKSKLYGKPLSGGGSSGSLGVLTLLLVPLLFVRRCYS